MEKEEPGIIQVLCSISPEGGQLLPFLSLPSQRFTFLPQPVQFMVVLPNAEGGPWGKQEDRVWEHGWAITTKLRERQRQATLQIRRGQAVAQLTGVGWGPIAGSLGFVLLLLAGAVGGGSWGRGMPTAFHGSR